METKFSASNHERYEPAGTTHSQARKETWKTYFSRTAEHAGTLWWIAMMWWTRLLRNRPSRANRLKMNILRCLHFGKFISLRLVSVCVLSLARPFCVWEKKKKKKVLFGKRAVSERLPWTRLLECAPCLMFIFVCTRTEMLLCSQL